MSINKQAASGQKYPKVIGLLGGTFDPPHIGHLVVAAQVKSALNLDEVWLVVANDPWQKEGTRAITAASRRIELVQAALSSQPTDNAIVVSDIEIRLGGPSYTINTLEAAQQEVPEASFTIVIGTDVLAELDTWHRSSELQASARFAVVRRAGYKINDVPGPNFQVVEIPALDISSTELRKMVRDGRPIDFLTPAAVIQHIEAQGLYSQG